MHYLHGLIDTFTDGVRQVRQALLCQAQQALLGLKQLSSETV